MAYGDHDMTVKFRTGLLSLPTPLGQLSVYRYASSLDFDMCMSETSSSFYDDRNKGEAWTAMTLEKSIHCNRIAAASTGSDNHWSGSETDRV